MILSSLNIGIMKQKIKAGLPISSHNGNGNKNESALEKLFTNQLKDILYAEQLLLKVLTELKEASTTEELEDTFDDHRMQTERHIKRLEKIFRMMDKPAEGKKCEAMEGLVREAKTFINETKQGSMTRDAAIIIAAQKIEHYEIASYGGLIQLAITLGMIRAADLLDKTLAEEEEVDQVLSEIAEDYINIEAGQEEIETSRSLSSFY